MHMSFSLIGMCICRAAVLTPVQSPLAPTLLTLTPHRLPTVHTLPCHPPPAQSVTQVRREGGREEGGKGREEGKGRE